MGACELICGYCGRLMIAILTAGGVTCSTLAILGCQFFWYESSDASILPPPYTNQTEGYVGILYFFDNDDQTCQKYDSLFLEMNKDIFTNMFIASQISGIIGPCCGFLAFIINMMEWCCCQMSLTYFLAFLALFFAFVSQGLTFLVYGQNEFCFSETSTVECKIEIDAIMSIAAAGAYYIACVIWCCMPRPEPAFGKKEDDDDGENKGSSHSHDLELDVDDANSPSVSGPQQVNEAPSSWQSVEQSRSQWQNNSAPTSNNSNMEASATQETTQPNGGQQPTSTAGSNTGFWQQQNEQEQQRQQQALQQQQTQYMQQQQQIQQMQQNQRPPVQEADFENPFTEGADTNNFERPGYAVSR